mmetsp:Transcript_29629/g.45168  ORF Transcript_29629/g.45168 Transcript_29629/m.45168 type:complete len:83 (+) Transcript_29629:1451-1699(+)
MKEGSFRRFEGGDTSKNSQFNIDLNYSFKMDKDPGKSYRNQGLSSTTGMLKELRRNHQNNPANAALNKIYIEQNYDASATEV